jgi:predicted MFS family arabinose efflux permease
MSRRTQIVLINAMGLVQGLALVTFPAASSIFTSPHGYGFSASRYGMMFIPQVALAILSSSLGPRLARRWTLKRVLQAGLSADLLSMILLAGSRFVIGSPAVAYGVLLVATGLLGFGFGATIMALNTYAQELAPGHVDRSVLVLNALLGAGTALAPLFVAIFLGAGVWWLMPLMVAGALIVLLLASVPVPLKASVGGSSSASSSRHLPGRFWLFAAGALLYGVVETLNGNWSGPYLTTERRLSAVNASFALMAFWTMVTVGRVLFATVSSKRAVRWIYVGLPLYLILAFQLVSRAGSETAAIVTFALTGLGCSAILPLCISLSGREFPQFAAVLSGEVIAFYQAGYGVAAFGVGPLRDFAGVSFHAIFSFGSAIAAAMFILAIAVRARGAKVPSVKLRSRI